MWNFNRSYNADDTDGISKQRFSPWPIMGSKWGPKSQSGVGFSGGEASLPPNELEDLECSVCSQSEVGHSRCLKVFCYCYVIESMSGSSDHGIDFLLINTRHSFGGGCAPPWRSPKFAAGTIQCPGINLDNDANQLQSLKVVQSLRQNSLSYHN